VGGAPRSGTTLVQNILDSHKDICGLPELLITPNIIELRCLIHRYIKTGLFEDICTYDESDTYVKAFIESFKTPFMNKYDCKYISEKTIHNVLVFDDLIELFTKARFIHVVCD
jgi:hypothetical protein